ncbi:hypothetical protein MAJ_05306, partial [Metarhizium majus ARSEF 297]
MASPGNERQNQEHLHQVRLGQALIQTQAPTLSRVPRKDCKDPRHHIRFHGTQRACYEGSSGDKWKPCSNKDCYTCSILRNGFSLSKSAPSSMFGPAIYSTIVSSSMHVMLCRFESVRV